MMPRTAVSVLLTVALAAGPSLRFDKRISKENEALHALNRLTFGPRLGDLEVVAKMGVKKWVDAQLNPDGIAQNAILDARLKPLASVSMSQDEIAENYPPRQLIRAFAAGRLPLPKD